MYSKNPGFSGNRPSNRYRSNTGFKSNSARRYGASSYGPRSRQDGPSNQGYSNNFRGRNGGGGFKRGGRKTPHYDISMFIKKAEPQKNEDYNSVHQFTDFNLDEKLVRGIVAKGYKNPTPIQDQAIPALLEGKDVVGMANTGTGKTAAFLIPLINKVLNERNQKVLIIAPTRELAVQIQEELTQFTRNMGIYSVLCIGGVGMRGQIIGLQRNHNFVIGTPGRLKDLERQRRLNLSNYRSVVLDEVDRMLDMGFIVDVKYLISKLPKERQSLFFSATLPVNVQSIMREFLKDPVTISVKSQQTSTNVEQDVIKLNGRDKVEVLNQLLLNKEFEKVLVFGRTKHGMEKLAYALEKKGVQVSAIHGNKSQGQRQRAIKLFKERRVQVLVATDIASRGLDIDDVTHVINYDLPETYEDYIHRIGRTGRANKKGMALTFIDR